MTFRERIIKAMQFGNIQGPSHLAGAISGYLGKAIKPQSISYLIDPNNNAQKSKYTRAIAKVCGVSYLWLSEGIGEMQGETILGAANLVMGAAELNAKGTVYKRAPVVGLAQLGPEGFWLEGDYPVGQGDGWVEIPSDDPNVYSLEVRGDSMTPALRDGWLVVIEPNTPPVQGEFVMVKTQDGRSMVKEYLFNRAGRVSLSSINKDYNRITLDETEIEKLHYVAAIMPPSKRKHL